MKNDRIVYLFFRPDGVPCYVGKGKPSRPEDHAKGSHNPHLKRIFAKAGGELPVVVIRGGLSDEEANRLEMALIAAIGRMDQGKGPLVNHTDGGEGTTGKRWKPQRRPPCKEDTKEKIAVALTGREGTPHTAEQTEKIRKALTGKKRTPEQLVRIQEAQRNKNFRHTWKARLQMSKERKARGLRPPSAKGTKWWHTPDGKDYRAIEPRDAADMGGRVNHNHPKECPSTAEALLGKTHSPERIANMKAGQRAALERKRKESLSN